MKGFGKLHIKSGVSGLFKEPLRGTHLTTFNFGQIQPVLCLPCIAGDRFNSIKITSFSRLSPLAKPTYGDFSQHSMSVFVPGYQLADDYEAWRVGRVTFEGKTPSGRYISMISLVSFYRQYVFSGTSVPSGSTSDGKGRFVNGSGVVTGTYKWVYVDSNGTTTYCKFRDSLGKYFFKVLLSLGYGIPSNVDLQTTSAWYQYYNQPKNYLNAFPLLAFAKAFNDWMSQSQRYNDSNLTKFLSCIKHNTNSTGYVTTTKEILTTGIYYLLSDISLCYENDYFTSAWEEPNQPVDLGYIGQTDVSASTTVPGTGDKIDPLLYDVRLEQHANDVINARSISMLQRVEQYVKRRHYSGSKAVQQVFSETGIKPEDYKSNYCHIIDFTRRGVQVGDVMSTADTSNAILGDYAGKGISGNTDNFKYHCTDYGYLLYLTWFTVKPVYPYGFDRQVLRADHLELYNSEFDGLGAEAISMGEVATDPLRISTVQDNDVFGFTERYNSYRFLRDKITGDFLDFSPYGEMNTWHCARILGDVRASSNMIAQSTAFCTMSPDTSEFNRIFSYTGSDFDHFLSSFIIEINGTRPIKSFSQAVGLGVGDLSVSKNGNEVS